MTVFPPGPPSSTPPLLKPSATAVKGVQISFKEAQSPLEPSLTLPEEYIDYTKAKEAYLSPLKTLEVPDKVENPKNKKSFQAISKTAANIAEFVRGRPGTFALLLVGLGFLLVAITVLGLSFTGVVRITLAHTAIPLGLVFTVVMGYYGWTFVNMAKSHSIDAEYNQFLEAWGKEQAKLTGSPLQSERLTVIEAGQSVVNAFHARYEKQRKEAEEAFTNEQKKRAQLLSARTQLDSTLASRGLTQEGKGVVSAISQEAFEGTHLALSTMLKPILVDEDITLPPASSAPENIQKRENILAKFKQFVLDHPLATALLSIGLITLVLAIPVSIYFFEGLTTITVIGSLSAILIPQLIVYGLSFLYEAKNSLNIDERKKRLEHMKRIQLIIADFYEQRKTFTDRIDEDIRLYGEKIAKEEKKAAERVRISAETTKKAQDELITAQQEALQLMAKKIAPEVAVVTYTSFLNDQLQETAMGAATVGKEVVKRA